MIKLKSEILLKITVFLFLFSPLITRITNFNFNILFYICYITTILLAFKYIIINSVTKWIALFFLIFVLYTFNPNTYFVANIWGAKDFLLPFFAIGLGSIIYKHNEEIINYVNVIYVIFVAYGLLQIVSFHCGLFTQILPWDALYLLSEIERGAQNFYQGSLLRYFGTMAVNFQYQVLILFLLVFLWLNKDIVNNLKLLYINTFLGVGFLAFSLERSPILMLLIFVVIWQFKVVITNWKKIMLVSFVILIIIFIFPSLSKILADNDSTSAAWIRLSNAMTLKFNEDAAVQSRQSDKWDPSIEIIKKHPWGIGVANVSSSAKERYQDYVNYNNCHNNYLSNQVAYGYFGGIFLMGLMVLLFYEFKKLPSKYEYFGYGLTVSYFCMAFFLNVFIDKPGILFFLLVGYLFSVMGTKTVTIKW